MATSKVIELIVKAKDQASKTLDDISKNTEKLNNSLKEVRQISTVATTALVALWGVMVNDAAKTEPVQKAFDWLAESIGENSKDMFNAINDAAKWTVWGYELMLSANRAMKLGVAKNTDEMVDLMKIARLYGQQMGEMKNIVFYPRKDKKEIEKSEKNTIKNKKSFNSWKKKNATIK